MSRPACLLFRWPRRQLVAQPRPASLAYTISSLSASGICDRGFRTHPTFSVATNLLNGASDPRVFEHLRKESGISMQLDMILVCYPHSSRGLWHASSISAHDRPRYCTDCVLAGSARGGTGVRGAGLD